MGTHDEDRTLVLPGLIAMSLLEVATALHRIVDPGPSLSIVDLELHKTALDISRFQMQHAGALVERRMIRGSWSPWLAFVLPALVPVRTIGQVRSNLANGIFDHASAVDDRHVRKHFSEVPAFPGMRVLTGGHRTGFCPRQ